MNKKIIMVLCLSLLLVSLVGCGNESNDETTNKDVSSSEISTNVGEPKESVSYVKGNIDKIELDYSLAMNSEDYISMRMLETMIEDYSKINPNAFLVVGKNFIDGSDKFDGYSIDKESFKPIDLSEGLMVDYLGQGEYEVIEFNENMILVNKNDYGDYYFYTVILNDDSISFESEYRIDNSKAEEIKNDWFANALNLAKFVAPKDDEIEFLLSLISDDYPDKRLAFIDEKYRQNIFDDDILSLNPMEFSIRYVFNLNDTDNLEDVIVVIRSGERIRTFTIEELTNSNIELKTDTDYNNDGDLLVKSIVKKVESLSNLKKESKGNLLIDLESFFTIMNDSSFDFSETIELKKEDYKALTINELNNYLNFNELTERDTSVISDGDILVLINSSQDKVFYYKVVDDFNIVNLEPISEEEVFN